MLKPFAKNIDVQQMSRPKTANQSEFPLEDLPHDVQRRVLESLPLHLQVPDKSSRSAFVAWTKRVCPFLGPAIDAQLCGLRTIRLEYDAASMPRMLVNGVTTFSKDMCRIRRQALYAMVHVILVLHMYKTELDNNSVRIALCADVVEFRFSSCEIARTAFNCQAMLRLLKSECSSTSRPTRNYRHNYSVHRLYSNFAMEHSRQIRCIAAQLLERIFLSLGAMHGT